MVLKKVGKWWVYLIQNYWWSICLSFHFFSSKDIGVFLTHLLYLIKVKKKTSIHVICSALVRT